MLQFVLYVCSEDGFYLLRKRGEVNYTKRSSPVKRWMNKYMGLIIQIRLEHVRVGYRITNSS